MPVIFLLSCSTSRKSTKVTSTSTSRSTKKAAPSEYIRSTVALKKSIPEVEINTKSVKPDKVVSFALMQLGVPYAYGSIDKKKGFDCSGFINYVFIHFKINVPRVSYMFTNAGVDIPIEFCKPGDLILFTGSDSKSGIVGHMGIITKNDRGNVEFIHASTSRGVMISDMNSYFVSRFVRVNRIFIPSLPR